MNAESLKEAIKRELPGLLREDPALRAYILELTRQEYAGRAETQDRFYDILAELRRDREEQARKRDEQHREQSRKWDEQNRKWDEQNRKWDEQNRKWDEQNQQWKDFTQEQNRKWEEQNRKWDEHQAQQREEFDRVHEEIMALAKKHERSIGALGARWGMQIGESVPRCPGLDSGENFGVQVLNVNEYDDEGVVFGRPDQIELDMIIKNGLLLICELKSSMDKAGDVYLRAQGAVL